MGFEPDSFWRQTPRLIHEAIKGRVRRAENEHRARGWLAWTTAALHRSKKMPPLDKVIGRAKARKPMSVAEQAARMKAIALQFGGKIVKRGEQ